MDKFFENSSSTIAAIKEALVPVAAKIGQGAEYAWEVVVKQQYVEGITGLIFSVLFILFFIVMLVFFVRQANKWERKSKEMTENKASFRNERKQAESNMNGYAVAALVTGIIGALVTIGMLTWAYHSTLQLLNPDFYAFQFFIDLAHPPVVR